MTVGASGFALANGIYENNELNFNDDGISVDETCTIATHYVTYDECGNHLWTFKDSFEASGELCNGNEGGLTIRRVREEISGCIN